jgi:hypothetical protein
MNKKENEEFTNISSEILFHFNPITLISGFMLGLIIYKFYQDSTNLG